MAAPLVVVGGSYAAVQIAASARQSGWQDRLIVVSEETDAPYQRPPLSKGYLAGETAEASLALRGEAFYRDNAIELELGVRIASIDRAAKAVQTADGRAVPYGRLALATGARPRALPVEGAALEGVHLLRTLVDARVLRERLGAAASVAVVGGGFIGLEAAAACAKLGKAVAVIEAQPRLMSRALPPFVAEWFAGLHRRRGVALHLGAAVRALEGERGRVRAVALADGTRVRADLVIVGIGVAPNQELAQAAGLECSDGIVVDRFGRTSDPEIASAGDCTRHPSRYAAVPLRLESVQNAQDQARTAGATLAGRQSPYDCVPWFWSEQFDARLQMAGLSDAAEAHAVRGSPEEGRFSVVYFRAGRIVAVDSVNRPGEHMLARKLVAAAVACTPAQAADPAFDLKTLLPAGA